MPFHALSDLAFYNAIIVSNKMTYKPWFIYRLFTHYCIKYEAYVLHMRHHAREDSPCVCFDLSFSARSQLCLWATATPLLPSPLSPSLIHTDRTEHPPPAIPAVLRAPLLSLVALMLPEARSSCIPRPSGPARSVRSAAGLSHRGNRASRRIIFLSSPKSAVTEPIGISL